MGFKTKIDYSNGRQINQRPGTVTELPGATHFGQYPQDLEKGPDLTTAKTTVPSVDNVVSTFTGDTSTGVYTYSFGTENMELGEPEIDHYDLTNSNGDTQVIGPIWEGVNPTVIDGETFYESYTGITYDLTLSEIEDLGNNQVSGTTRSTVEYLEADALDYQGDFIWVKVNGVTQTDSLVIDTIGTGPSTLDLGADAEGKVVNVASDERLKENIEPIQGALEKVLGLKGVTYNWKDRKSGGDAVRIGFIAQQVKEVVPELVYDIPGNEYMSVYYNNAVPLIIEAMKEIVAKQKDLATEISEIEVTPIQEVKEEPTPENTTNTKEFNVEVIYAEDNNIELNYNGTHETAFGGGITVLKGVNDEIDSTIKTNENGDWELFPGIALTEYTPTSTQDPMGNKGNVVYDDDYMYIKTSAGWKRTSLSEF